MRTATNPRFALNHMAAPWFGLAEFFTLARNPGVTDAENCDDISARPIPDATPADTVKAAAVMAGVAILGINALQRFNNWTPERQAGATALADYAEARGVQISGNRSFSFEPFATDAYTPATSAAALGKSMAFIRAALVGLAA